MTGFVSSPPAAAAAAALAASNIDVVGGDGWFPSVSVAEARASLRIPDVVTAIRVRDALRAGMLGVRRELRAWQIAEVAAGAADLAGADADMIDGVSEYVLLYTRAVFAFAAADLVETHHDIGATNDGKDRAETRALSADEHRRNATHAIRDILRTTRTAVELI